MTSTGTIIMLFFGTEGNVPGRSVAMCVCACVCVRVCDSMVCVCITGRVRVRVWVRSFMVVVFLCDVVSAKVNSLQCLWILKNQFGVFQVSELFHSEWLDALSLVGWEKEEEEEEEEKRKEKREEKKEEKKQKQKKKTRKKREKKKTTKKQTNRWLLAF